MHQIHPFVPRAFLIGVDGSVRVFKSLTALARELNFSTIWKDVGPGRFVEQITTTWENGCLVQRSGPVCRYVVRDELGRVYLPREIADAKRRDAESRRHSGRHRDTSPRMHPGHKRPAGGHALRRIRTYRDFKHGQRLDEFEPARRAKRRRGNLPDYRDDFFVGRLRNWKKQRRTQWKPLRDE